MTMVTLTKALRERRPGEAAAMAQGQLGDKGRSKLLFCKVTLGFLGLDPRTKRSPVNKNQAKVCVLLLLLF